MPSWWGKSSSKDANKKANKEGIIDAIQRKLKTSSDIKHNSKPAGSRRNCSDAALEKGSRSQVPSRSPSPSPSPSTQVSRCQSFVERPHAQPLPLPIFGRTISEIIVTSKPIGQIFLPLSHPVGVPNGMDQTEANGDIATASISYASSIDSDDPSDSRVLSPLASDCENGNRTTTNSPHSMIHKDQSSKVNESNSKISLKPPTLLSNNQIPSTSASPKRGHIQNLMIPRHGAFFSPPDSSISSPCRSPMRGVVPEQISNTGFWSAKLYPETASAHCSSTGSGHNSPHNLIGVDMLGQIFWPQSRCSPECSPIPSPSIACPGPSSRIHSGAVTPLHPRAGGAVADSSNNWPDDGKQQSHRLPLPPISVSNFSPFSTTYSAAVTPSAPRSPGRVENLASPGSRWKKGRLLGRGTFGHVYLGFNSESGEMCAMKEVTLFSDDAKSKESVQQLGQEISVLSRLRHPNIVQYYGSETVEDKLYIYLEYVSGGSIYKLLQEYGQFGESAIRNYTQQILSGLTYLHAKTTVHRDIKGANILVDPSGRVKLSDFGMAKHISGQSCPLSFKGSPYWMAPEVIKNSNGCNLAVDIWSLGCTVLEMATTKPPWSQYEGVAAMFKIGNSKELPAIPDHLSDDGRDFVRLCLQRNPSHRPTAAQLLEHPFVKYASQLERTIGVAEPSEASTTVTNPVRSLGIGQQGRNISFPDSDGIDIYQYPSSKAALSSSGTHTPRNISCSVSPVGSPLLHSRSPKHASGRMSPSPISSPLSRSGSSTPLTGVTGAIPFHPSEQPTYPYEGTGGIKTCQYNLRTAGGTFYNEAKPDFFPGISQTSCVRRDVLTSNNNTVNMIGRSKLGDPRDLDGKLFLADCVSQQLLRDHLKLNTSLDRKPSSPLTNWINRL